MVGEVSVLSHVTNSAIVVYGLQLLKGTTWYRRCADKLPIANAKIHVMVSALGAFATAVGMHGAVTGSATDGWKLALAIPPLWIVLHATWDWAQQMALNQIVFAVAVQQKEAAPALTVPVGNATVTAAIQDKP